MYICRCQVEPFRTSCSDRNFRLSLRVRPQESWAKSQILFILAPKNENAVKLPLWQQENASTPGLDSRFWGVTPKSQTLVLPKPQSCLLDALLVFLDVTVNLECLQQRTSPLSSESGLFTASPFSDNDISVGTNCTCELASGFPTLPDILNLWKQVLSFVLFCFVF